MLAINEKVLSKNMGSGTFTAPGVNGDFIFEFTNNSWTIISGLSVVLQLDVESGGITDVHYEQEVDEGSKKKRVTFAIGAVAAAMMTKSGQFKKISENRYEVSNIYKSACVIVSLKKNTVLKWSFKVKSSNSIDYTTSFRVNSIEEMYDGFEESSQSLKSMMKISEEKDYQIEALTTDIQNFKDQIDTIKTSCDAKIAEVEKNSENLDQKLSEKINEIKELESKLAISEEKATKMIEDIKKEREEFELCKNSEIEALKQAKETTITNLEKEIESLNLNIETLTKEKEEVVASMEKRYQNLLSDYGKVKYNNTVLQKDLEENSKNAKSKDEEISVLKNNLETTEEQYETIKQFVVQNAKNQKDQIEKLKKTHQNELEVLLKDHNEKIEFVKRDFNKFSDEHMLQFKDIHETEIADIKEKHSKEIEVLHEKHQFEMKSLQEKYAETCDRLVELQKSHDLEKSNLVSSLEKANVSLEELQQSFDMEKNELVCSLEDANNRCDMVSTENAKLNAQVEKLQIDKKDVSEQNNIIGELEKNVSEQNTTIAQLKAEIKSKNAQMIRISQTVDKYTQMVDSTIKDNSTTCSDLTTELESKNVIIKNLKLQLRTSQRQVNDIIDSNNKVVFELQERIEHLKQFIYNQDYVLARNIHAMEKEIVRYNDSVEL